MLNFVVAMAQNPEVQRRAQAEIDSVVGTVRLPDFGDRSSLPYVEAVYRETLRWHPAAPLGKFCRASFLTLHHRRFRCSPCNIQC